MPDADLPWTHAELDAWVHDYFDGELWKLDAAPSWEEYDPELDISTELHDLNRRLDDGFKEGWFVNRSLDLTRDPTRPLVNAGSAPTAEQRWDRLSLELKTRLRRLLEDEPEPAPEVVEESIVPELLGQHTTAFVPGEDPDPVGDVLRRPWMRWAALAFGSFIVVLAAVWLFAQRYADDEVTATEPSAGAVALDDESSGAESDGDESSGDAGPPAHDCTEGSPVVATEGEVDPLVTPETAQAHRGGDGRIYIEICFTGAWTDTEAMDRQWSMFAGILAWLGDLGGYSAAEQHDEVRRTMGVLVPGETEFDASVWILPNGNVLFDTGRSAGDVATGDLELEMASTPDEADTKRTATATAQVDVAGAPDDADSLIGDAEGF